MVDYSDIHTENFHYGIVVDAGSSGSRLHIYKWLDLEYIKTKLGKSNPKLLVSVPQIISNPKWSKKITPGLSYYGKQPEKIWNDHLTPLLEFAKSIIPTERIKDTPIFIQATAGMRLLPNAQQNNILNSVCNSLKKNTEFMVTNCQQQVQIIDGETEGLYGWLSLNYLAQKLNDFHTEETAHTSLGFMDMGGASTQIAFVPSNKSEVERHANDMSTVRLRSVNGDIQDWKVFVSTWLGFGANQARRRYLKSLITLYDFDDPESDDEDEDDHSKSRKKPIRKLNDPCSPKGLISDTEINGRVYSVQGIGDYDMCLKEQYPLLLKNLPCDDDPCLFNGVHVPRIDFDMDKFVGISEYWYTINDIFNLGGVYNFEKFNVHLKKFCESDWHDEIIKNFSDNKYNGIKLDYLKDSCFKGSWVVNILHEGFSLPRIDFEKSEDDPSHPDKFYFKSAAEINGYELSWTLGKMVLYASSRVAVSGSKGSGKYSNLVGIVPSETDQKYKNKQEFIPGNFEIIVSSSHLSNFKSLPKDEKLAKINHFFVYMILLLALCSFMLHFLNTRFGLGKLYRHILHQTPAGKTVLRVNHFTKYHLTKLFYLLRRLINTILGKKTKLNVSDFSFANSFDNDINLEEGLISQDQADSQHLQTADGLRSNNNSYLNFNFMHLAGPTAFLIYNNGTANNSVASLYSAASITSKATNAARGLNKSTSNLDSNQENSDLASPQLRSRVSLFNLNNANNNNNNNNSNNNNGFSGNNSNFLNIYKSPRHMALTGSFHKNQNSAANEASLSAHNSPRSSAYFG